MPRDATTIVFLPELVIRLGQEDERIRGEIPSALAARLALTPGVVVPTETLVSELWADPPETAAVSLRVAMSKLRATPLAAVLEGGRGGYRLAVDPGSVDLVALEAALAEPAAPGLVEELASFESHWWGEPFAVFAGRPFAEPAARRLAAARLAGATLLARLRMEAAAPDEAARGLERLAAAHPLDEAVAGLRARALAACGRAADALAVLDGLRSRLCDELGLEPSGELETLRREIVRGGIAVTPAAHAAATEPVERHGIPLPLTRFVGRAHELAELEEARGASRLVTLLGPGGVGKTRLAVEAARRVSRDVDDEQWMVDLASVTDAAGVLVAVAESLGAAEATPAAIARRLDGQRALLVIDNAEHVVDAVRALLRELLTRTAGLTVVVTSREALKIPGERIVRVRPMLDEHLGDAARLFADRAGEIRPELGLRAEDAAVRELCAALDGIPLALELAAAQLDVLELDEVAAAVAAGAEGPGMAARHASVTEAIRSSVALLDAGERELLAQLALFAGTFRAEDAAEVCRLGDRPVPAVLHRLVQKSLVALAEHGSAGRRLRLLESVKAYCHAQLPTDAAAWAQRRRGWAASLVDNLAPALRGHGAREARVLLDLAAPDLQRALADAVAVGDRPVALRIAGGQSHYWMTRGMLAEGCRSIEEALSCPGEAPVALEAVALSGVALLSYQAGDPEKAMGYLERALGAAAAAGDVSRSALLHAYAAYAASLFGDRERAEPLIEAAVGMLDGVEPWARAEVRLCQGQTLRALGSPATALERLAEARVLAERIGYDWVATSACYVAGKVLVDVRRSRDAVEMLVPGALRAFRDEDPTSALALLHLVAGACAALEQHRTGAELLGAVDRLGERYGYHPAETEGEETRRHREQLTAGLTPAQWSAAYGQGAGLDFAGAFALAATLLPRAARRSAAA